MKTLRIYVVFVVCVLRASVAALDFTLASSFESVTVSWPVVQSTEYNSFTIALDGSVQHTVLSEGISSGGSYVLTLLAAGRTYSITMAGTRADGQTDVLLSQQQTTRPYDVSSVTASGVTTSSITFQWSPQDGSTQDSYKLALLDLDVSDATALTVTTSATFYRATDLLPGHQYKLTVVVMSQAEQSPGSNFLEYTVPLQPTSVTVAAHDGDTLAVTWLADPASIQDSFSVKYFATAGSMMESPVQGCSHTACSVDVDPSLNPGSTFGVKVAAVRGDRTSTFQTGYGQTRPESVPSLTLSSLSMTSLHITWPGVVQATNYRVALTPEDGVESGPSEDPASPGTWQYRRDSLVPGRAYIVAVFAISGVEESLPTSQTFYTRPPVPGPPTPQETLTTSLTVTWSAPSAGEFDNYKVVIMKTADGSSPLNPQLTTPATSDRQANFTQLVPGAQYTISLTTLTGPDNIESETGQAEARFYTRPLAPAAVTAADQQPAAIGITWEAPTSSDPHELTTYWAQLQGVDNSRKTLSADSAPLRASFTELSDGSLYTVEVASISGDQTSTIVALPIYTRPLPPSGLALSAVSTTTLTVDWTAPSSANFELYTITLAAGGTELVSESLGPTLLTHTFTSLQPATEYTISLLTRVDTVGSEAVSITLNTQPPPPSNLVVTSKDTSSVSVSWVAPAQPVVVHSYTLSADIPGDDSAPLELTTQDTSMTLMSLRAGAVYHVSVMAVTSGVSSEAATAMVTLVPHSVASLSVSYVGQTSVEVMWQVPLDSDYTAFKIWVSDLAGSVVDSAMVERDVIQHELTGLSAGRQYMVFVASMAGSEQGESASTPVTTLPSSVTSMEVTQVTTSVIRVTWQEPGDTQLTHYELAIAPNHGALTLPVTVDRSAQLDKTFSGLQPGVLYTISIAVVATTTVSESVSREVSTYPAAALDLSATEVGGAVRVTWAVDSASTQQAFQVSYVASGGAAPISASVAWIHNQLSYTHDLTSVLPGYTYQISVSAVSNGLAGGEESVFITTTPDPVVGLGASVESSTTARLVWVTSSRGAQDHFVYTYQGLLLNPSWSEPFQTDSTGAVVVGLFPGEQYNFKVTAVTAGVTSPATYVTATMFPLTPTGLVVNTNRTGHSFVVIQWQYDTTQSHVTHWEYRRAQFGSTRWESQYLTDPALRETPIGGLTSGQNYTVEVYALTAGNVRSQTAAEVLATVRPQCNAVPWENTAETTNSQVAIMFTDNTLGVFDNYIFTINTTVPAVVSKRADDADKTVRFSDGIVNGTYYQISLKVTSGAEVSDVNEYQTITVISNPFKPSVQANQQQDSIQLKVTPGEGGVEKYRVECRTAAGSCPTMWQEARPGVMTTVEYTGLRVNTAYKFTVVAVVGSKLSTVVDITARTQEAPPGPVTAFQYTAISSTSVTVAWDVPLAPNGNITHYKLIRSGDTQIYTVTGDTLAFSFSGLLGGRTYSFKVWGVTAPGEGAISTQMVTMPISPPGIVITGTKAQPIATGSLSHDQFTVELVDPFSEENGYISGYAVIVSIQPDSAPGNPAATWAQRQRAPDSVTAYQATTTCGFLSLASCIAGRRRRDTGDTTMFTVGRDSCSSDGSVYCNGALSPKTTYYVALRAYTDNGKQFKDGPYSTAITTGANMLVWYIVGAVAGGVVFLVLLLLAVFMLRRTLCPRHDAERATAKPLELDEARTSMRRRAFGETSRPVKVADFVPHTREMARDSDFKYSEQYEDLKGIGREQPCTASELPCNRIKNRFTNILPYDHSRVKLLPTDDVEGSDYINANYMPGYNSRREFIVTQGCLPSTRDDFWRMIWEQESHAIVMLTKCVEKGREKCDHYWPVDAEPMYYGDIQVQILNETKCPTWIVTEFKIAMGVHSRKVTHFHYIDWPDFGVPNKPQSLVAFVRLVRSKLVSPNDGQMGPVVTHCSAGVGRSGAYIALDHILQALQDKAESIDIYGLVYDMRKYRPHMVQTEAQYICVHNCVVHVLEGGEDEAYPYPGDDNAAYEDDEGITME